MLSNSIMDGQKYQISQAIIAIDGKSVSADFIEDIIHVSVEESLHMPSMCSVVIKNDYFPGRGEEDKTWKHDSLLQMGKSISITFESSTTNYFNEKQKQKIFDGEITGIECHFTDESQATIIIRGYDLSHRLHRGRYNRSFQNMTDSDLVKKIAQEVGIKIGEIDNSGAPHDYVFQENQTNMDFLRERAFRIGFELYVQDQQLNFVKPKNRGNLDLEWLKDLNSFRVRVSSAEQVSSVEVRGWDYQQKKAIIGEAQTEQVITKNQYGNGQSVSTKFSQQPPKMIVVDQPIVSTQQANQIAQTIYNELGGEFVCADARAEGNPEIRVGKVVNLQNMGKYDGQYYITETHHSYHQRVYITEFTVRGLRGGNLLNLLSPSTHLQPGQTFLIGIVTDNNDPKALGRVKVKFPTLTEDHSSDWARVVAIGAGVERGFDCLPEVNDEVLVGFEHGDIHRPFVIGGIWNGQDKPPESVNNSVKSNKVRLRTFKTRTGHIFQFVEEDNSSSKAGIYLTTTKGHQINLNDSDRFIEIKTKDGHQLKMDDQGKSITLKTTGGHNLKMDDQGASISLSSTGNLNIEAQGNIEIKANGTITVNGAMIYLN